jgi:hypothetical protein
MKLADTYSMPGPLGIEPIERFIPEPVEAWTLADFVGLELVTREDDDAERLIGYAASNAAPKLSFCDVCGPRYTRFHANNIDFGGG